MGQRVGLPFTREWDVDASALSGGRTQCVLGVVLVVVGAVLIGIVQSRWRCQSCFSSFRYPKYALGEGRSKGEHDGQGTG